MATQKQRFIAVGGIVLIVILAMLAFFGANTAAKVMTVEEASQPSAIGQRVQVEGNVVNDSFTFTGDILDFTIADADNPQFDLKVTYDKGVAATFGNGITAQCTGVIDDSGVLVCSELITKCPSKYESRTDALTVERLQGYGDAIVNKIVKVSGTLQPGSLKDATADVRFVIGDAENSSLSLPVQYAGALSDEVTDGAALVLTGRLDPNGNFEATEVALEA